ncbi:MAG TPA: adenylate/guanylate cyclase domain-containing protein, partial [Gemmatimonadales bacterium]
VRDLGSANGTLLNDAALADGVAAEGDVLAFGRVRFRVSSEPAGAEPPREDSPAHAVDVRSGGGALAHLRSERLARLVDLARALSGEIDTERLLRRVVTEAAALLPADRVALLLRDEATGEYRLRHWINRLGESPVRVPGSIARRAVAERAPIVTENAADDARFQSGSVATDRVRAALAVPLLTGENAVPGVLYLDSLTMTRPFDPEEAALCFAFGGLAAVSIATARLVETAHRQDLVRANFERFFAPDVAARIARSRSGVRPGGERRAVAVLFSDVRGFTGLAETLPPETVAGLLSDYYSVMVDLVFEYGGTLDKFAGDSLLAVWGAPAAGTDDAGRALAAARTMQEELVSLNRRWAASGRPALAVGIGLHAGEAFAGTIGSPRRLDYTVIGDVVNVAARLCQAAAPGQILVSEALRRQLADPPRLGPMQALRLRGRDEEITVYRVEAE